MSTILMDRWEKNFFLTVCIINSCDVCHVHSHSQQIDCVSTHRVDVVIVLLLEKISNMNKILFIKLCIMSGSFWSQDLRAHIHHVFKKKTEHLLQFVGRFTRKWNRKLLKMQLFERVGQQEDRNAAMVHGQLQQKWIVLHMDINKVYLQSILQSIMAHSYNLFWVGGFIAESCP